MEIHSLTEHSIPKADKIINSFREKHGEKAVTMLKLTANMYELIQLVAHLDERAGLGPQESNTVRDALSDALSGIYGFAHEQSCPEVKFEELQTTALELVLVTRDAFSKPEDGDAIH